MRLELGLLADDATKDQLEKLYIWGEFRYVFAAKLPAQHGHLAVVARLMASAPEVRDTECTLEFEIVDADGNRIVPRSPKLALGFKPIGPAGLGKVEAVVILKLNGMIITKYGDHAIHFWVNGVHVDGEIGFHVAQLPVQGAPNAS
jgi:hypothetical protein